jgi:predicted nucleic acid-binding protein
MGRVVLDSSVLITLLDPGSADVAKVADLVSAFEVNAKNQYLISSVSLMEVLVHPARAGDEHLQRVELAIGNWVDEVVVIDSELAREAARIRAKTGLKAPYALISATAIRAKAELWTFDNELHRLHTGMKWKIGEKLATRG